MRLHRSGEQEQPAREPKSKSKDGSNPGLTLIRREQAPDLNLCRAIIAGSPLAKVTADQSERKECSHSCRHCAKVKVFLGWRGIG